MKVALLGENDKPLKDDGLCVNITQNRALSVRIKNKCGIGLYVALKIGERAIVFGNSKYVFIPNRTKIILRDKDNNMWGSCLRNLDTVKVLLWPCRRKTVQNSMLPQERTSASFTPLSYSPMSKKNDSSTFMNSSPSRASVSGTLTQKSVIPEIPTTWLRHINVL